MRKWSFVFLLFFCALGFSKEEEQKLQAIYNSLDPKSISQLFAFYDLYPETKQGKEALTKAWNLIDSHREEKNIAFEGFIFPELDITTLIALVNKQPYEHELLLSKEQLTQIQLLCSHLKNRSLKGFSAVSREEVLTLPTEEVDLGRALLLFQYENAKDPLFEIEKYEATLDLMALQVLAKLDKNATSLEKIHAINAFIFHEMKFRFPPHSLWAKDIDVYTFLPSVIDNRQGVCLGVSILYLCIAQRLGVNLEIITPPGHIYVRFNDGEKLLNIETTARGINTPSEMYLGINTKSLHERNMKEVVGLAFMNQASVMLHKKDYRQAIDLYKKALLFTDDDLLKMLLGISYLMEYEFEKAEPLLQEVSGKSFEGSVYKETMPEDFLAGNATVDAIEAVFLSVDETRESIVEKQKILVSCLEECPKFRAGNLQLAVTWLQLGRGKEAKEALKKCHELDPNDPTVNYYLSILSMQRLEYEEAWNFLTQTNTILEKADHDPKILRSLDYQLRLLYPDPLHKNCN